MPAFNPPTELNGFPLSERSRWLLYAPIPLLIDPTGRSYPSPFGKVGWPHDLAQQSNIYAQSQAARRRRQYVVHYYDDTRPKRLDEALFGFRLF